ncbi:hypothetical protein [Microbacterium trichothecenolyticum]|nr:hypothetical protein [Microbacterium trichothecenolyticum]
MDDDVREELQRLRARAYGPGGDIESDPRAWARLWDLEDLEKQERERAQGAAVADARDGEAPPSAQSVRTAAPTDTIPDAEDPTPAAHPVPLLRTRRRIWVAALALAAVAAVASAATAAGTSFTAVDRATGTAQVDALTPAPDVELDAAGYLGFDPEQTIGYADYYGLTAFAGSTQIDSEGSRADCLLLADTVALKDADSTRRSSGVRSGGCGAGPFPATVEFVVTSSFPAEFRARFPVGSAVQFVRDGDDIGVFTDAR